MEALMTAIAKTIFEATEQLMLERLEKTYLG